MQRKSKTQRILDRKYTAREDALTSPIELKQPGSIDWCWQQIDALKSAWDGKLTSEERWIHRLRKLEAYEAWAKVPPEKPYGSLEALLKAEIGVDVQESVAIVKTRALAAKSLAKHGELGRGGDRVDVINSIQGGTSADYLTARIARDRPDILERMKAGAFSSVRQAAKEAGIVNERLSVPADPIRAAQYLKRRFTKTEFAALKKELLA
jgi:hypothetical protein